MEIRVNILGGLNGVACQITPTYMQHNHRPASLSLRPQALL